MKQFYSLKGNSKSTRFNTQESSDVVEYTPFEVPENFEDAEMLEILEDLYEEGQIPDVCEMVSNPYNNTIMHTNFRPK